MSKDINSDYLRGHIDTIILKTLFDGEKYGYEICKDIETKSNGSFLLKQPSLYSALKRLESSGLISSRWQDSEIGGKRHYYSLTEEGVKHYEQTQAEWNYSYNILHSLLSENTEQASPVEEKTEEVPKNDAEIIYSSSTTEDAPVVNLTDEITSKNEAEFGQLNFLAQNEEAPTQVEPEILTENETNNKSIVSEESEPKNDAMFINETIIDEDNDVSFSNNVYFRVKNEVQKAAEINRTEIHNAEIVSSKQQDNSTNINTKKQSSRDDFDFNNYEIKPYNKYNQRFKKSEFMKKNKFFFILSLLTSLFMAIEVVGLSLIFKFLNLETKLTRPFIIIFACIALFILAASIINLIINPYKKGIIRIKNQFLVKSIITIILIAVIIGLNLIYSLNCFTQTYSYTTILLPSVLVVNILIEEIIYNLLKNNVKFKA